MIESGKLPAEVIHVPVPPRRSISECIALLPEDSTATIDADFAKDVQAAVKSSRGARTTGVAPVQAPDTHRPWRDTSSSCEQKARSGG